MPVGAIESPRGKFSHIESGYVTTLRGAAKAELLLADLVFLIEFSAEEGGNQRVEAQGAGAKKLELRFINFEMGLPTTWEGEVGNWDGRPLWMAFTASMAGIPPLENRYLAYSFWQQGE